MLTNSNLHRDVLLVVAVTAAMACTLCAAIDTASAQGAFGVGHAVPHSSNGWLGWMLTQQAAYYRDFSGMIRATKTNGVAVYGLLGLSFSYGIFHAAGPGHGKAVISSYLIANGETWRRGIALSFASALLQALAAVAIVGFFAAVLGGTAATMTQTARAVEVASYCLIVAVGARLCWTKGRGFLAQLHGFISARKAHPGPQYADFEHVAQIAACEHQHGHDHDGAAHDHAHGECGCGHAHGPEPQLLAGPGGWRRGVTAILAVGLRPCSGAILVLVFALAQGLFWVGVVSTFAMGLGTAITVAAIATFAVAAGSAARKLASYRSGVGTLALRGLELGASLLVIGFGILLLMGYMATERLFGA